MTTVVICDPPSALRRSLAERVGSVPEVVRVDVVDDIQALGAALESQLPDVVLLASQPGDVRAATAVRFIRQSAPGVRVLLLTMGMDPDDVVSGMAAGAVGYLARDAAVAEAAAALALLPETAPRHALAAVAGHAETQDGATPELTERELQVLEGMSRGRSNSQIGEDLFLSEDTIKTHARRLFRKMQVNDRAHAVAEGFRRGLLV